MILIRSAQVVRTKGVEKADILIKDDRFIKIAPALTRPIDAEIVEAEGWLALPGLVDIHVHLREPGGEHKEDFYSGTCAALAGGVTTVLGMPNTMPPITDQASLDATLALAAPKAVCDFGLYLGATRDNVMTAPHVQRAVGLKMYMGSSTGPLLVDRLEDQYAHLAAYPADRIVAVHAEDEEAVQYFATRGERRPPLCAALATSRAILMAQSLGRPIHICHLSTVQEIQMVKEAKQRGEPVTCEVTPHHLFLSSEIEQHLGARGMVNPPLRATSDATALWDNLQFVDVIATDHAPHTLEEKDGDAPPSGVPGLETMLPLLLTAVQQQQMGLADLVRLTATGPAQLLGLEGKGRIAPGYDADLVLVDPEVQWTISDMELMTRCGWTPFEGWRARGKVVRVYLRGQLAFAEGQVLVRPGTGRPVRQVGHLTRVVK
jgi:dihydroorotase (multifunctional complex type)